MKRSLSDSGPVLLNTRRAMFPGLLEKIFLTMSETSNWTQSYSADMLYSTENISTFSFDSKKKK